MTTDARHVHLSHSDLRPHAEITVKIYGNETSWIGGVLGTAPKPGVVALCCKQLQLVGDIDALEALLADWSELLADVRQRPEDWQRIDFGGRRGTEGHVDPHPFTRQVDGGLRPPGPSRDQE